MKKLLILATLAAVTNAVYADAIFQASLTPDIAIYSRNTQINGFALNIWGENPQSSFNLGFVNGSTGDSQGVAWGLVNYADSYTGVAMGVVNVSRENFYGWQTGAVNYSVGTYTGLQLGGINVAQECQGLQLGIVNYAASLRGVQIGVLNVALNNSWFNEFPDKLAPAFPIINWSF